jgi:hypothetical protein
MPLFGAAIGALETKAGIARARARARIEGLWNTILNRIKTLVFRM